jgi:hypothetical protein
MLKAKPKEKSMAKKITQAQRIRDYFTKNPGKTAPEAAKAMGLKYQVVYMVKRNMDKKKAEPKQWKLVHVSTSDNSIEKAMANELPITMHEPKSDPVNHPAHYKVGGIETIDFIEAKQLNYNLGNVVKYITRADHKGNRLEDLEKARWYLDREIGNLSEKLATQLA